MSFILAVTIRLYMAAARSPPRSEPAHSQHLRPSTIEEQINRVLAEAEATDIAIYLCQDPVDFRLGINGLSVLVESTLRYDPFGCNLFVSAPGTT